MLLKFRLPEDPGRGPLCCIPLGFWSKSVEFYRLRNFEFKAWGPHFCTSGLPNLHAGILLRPFWGHLSSSLSKTDFGTNSSPFSSQSAFRVRFGTWVGVRFWISFWGPFSDQGWINSAHLGRPFWDRAPIRGNPFGTISGPLGGLFWAHLSDPVSGPNTPHTRATAHVGSVSGLTWDPFWPNSERAAGGRRFGLLKKLSVLSIWSKKLMQNAWA